MGVKEFLKPTIWKIILLIVLFAVSFYFSTEILASAGGSSNLGYPFQFFQPSGCYGPPGAEYPNCWDTELTSFWSLIANIIIWYLIACILMLIYNKIRKKEINKIKSIKK